MSLLGSYSNSGPYFSTRQSREICNQSQTHLPPIQQQYNQESNFIGSATDSALISPNQYAFECAGRNTLHSVSPTGPPLPWLMQSRNPSNDGPQWASSTSNFPPMCIAPSGHGCLDIRTTQVDGKC